MIVSLHLHTSTDVSVIINGWAETCTGGVRCCPLTSQFEYVQRWDRQIDRQIVGQTPDQCLTSCFSVMGRMVHATQVGCKPKVTNQGTALDQGWSPISVITLLMLCAQHSDVCGWSCVRRSWRVGRGRTTSLRCWRVSRDCWTASSWPMSSRLSTPSRALPTASDTCRRTAKSATLPFQLVRSALVILKR